MYTVTDLYTYKPIYDVCFTLHLCLINVHRYFISDLVLKQYIYYLYTGLFNYCFRNMQ